MMDREEGGMEGVQCCRRGGKVMSEERKNKKAGRGKGRTLMLRKGMGRKLMPRLGRGVGREGR